ncbi:hypothetical protein E8E13_000117 [Curvularia kusanoi]|uniref:Subtelomeric hrmA-associated cluster protein AFUB-079030/YDR124W-like helical bundle domain-containing protein n=1 Tax=Curvularia kusanoi TaxID=90978 RepID=A0A9P4T4C8_CURKU|nr:hypothetical protein E8E13_000117 [Curvularia kusanoi]
MKSAASRTSPQAVGCDEDPSTLTQNCDYPIPQKQNTATAGDKPAQSDDDEVAMPIPIATLVFHDGRTEPVYKPLAGHEHLFRAQPIAPPRTPFVNLAPKPIRPIQAAPTPVPRSSRPATPEQEQNTGSRQQSLSCEQKGPSAQRQDRLKSKSLKRTRSVARGLSASRKVALNEDVDESKDAIEILTEETRTFYIGDVNAFKEFLHCRFDELTMKPLRGIVTHWVKLLEPRRLGDWGKYHEMLPSEAETPPWWPATVIYKEPSHLKKNVDEMKRKEPWINKLRNVAKFTIQTTSADHFSSSKEGAHSEEMKKRAQEQILPSIFDVAQSYEDHVMQYSLFEGSGNVDSGRGKHHTWKPIPRPARRTTCSKRARRTSTRRADHAQEATYEASDEETEPDDITINVAESSLPALSPRPTTAVSQNIVHTPGSDGNFPKICRVDESVLTSGPCTPASAQGDCQMYRTASTPNSSFDQSMHGLHLEEDLDMKPLSRTPSVHGDMKPLMHTTPLQGNMQPYHGVPYNQPMQYPPSSAGFSTQMYQPQEAYTTSTPSTYAQATPTFVNPFSMYSAPSPVMGYGQYASPMRTTHAFSYDQTMYTSTPMSFTSTPMSMPMTPADTTITYNGLPADYAVDPEQLHHI